MNTMLTLVRRELMEHRAGWLVPAVHGALFVLVALLGVIGVARIGVDNANITLEMLAEQSLPAEVASMLTVILVPIAIIMLLVISIVVTFYLLDALYADRKDRSILFWKSLPVSDLRVVASKYLTALVAMPAQTVLVFVATAVLVWLIVGLAMLWAGSGQFLLQGPGAIAKATVILVYTLLTVGLWLAPIHGWLLLVSAFAKRAVLGWAVLPPLLLVLAERLIFGTKHFALLLAQRLSGGMELALSADHDGAISVSDDVIVSTFPALAELLTPGRLLAAPALWAGIAVAIVFMAGAVWLRRWRDES